MVQLQRNDRGKMSLIQKILAVILFFSALEYVSCSGKNNLQNPCAWGGKYEYEEEPVQAIAGYYMAMIWEISISKHNDSCKGILEVNGQQTFIKCLTDILGDTSSIAITYNKLIDGSDENFKKGDTLFMLSRDGDKIITKWFGMEPRLLEKHPKECNCFTLIKNKS
jgi:hypothetical protein